MIRAWLAIAVWGLMLIVPGIPVLLAGFVYPSRRLIAWSSSLWARVMLAICGVRLTVEGQEHLRDGKPKFFMGNHQSALDIPIVVLALKGDVRFMAKNTLFRSPVFGWILGRYGYVPVDRSHARVTLESLNRALDRLRRRPISLAVFPEGTRSADGRLLPFRKGTMKICRRAGLPAVPFSIDGSYVVNPRSWLRAYPGPVRLTFGEPIPAGEVAAMSTIELHDRVRQTIARQLGRSHDASAEDEPLTAPEGTQGEQQRDVTAAAHP
ncbi:MAG: lysophospholipid acyltransferase family protein [Phycisphaerae bacterium]